MENCAYHYKRDKLSAVSVFNLADAIFSHENHLRWEKVFTFARKLSDFAASRSWQMIYHSIQAINPSRQKHYISLE